MADDAPTQSPAEIQAGIDAARKQLAGVDLGTLRGFAALAMNDATTIGQLRAGVEGLSAELGDPERKAGADNLRIQWEGLTGQLATMISIATAAATAGDEPEA